MKPLAALIIIASLILGLIAASTAYLSKVDDVRAEDELTLNAPAGEDPEEEGAPLYEPDPEDPLVLTAERLETLREQGVQRVTVREFAWARWTHRWWFVLAAAGLVTGAVMIRVANRQALAGTLTAQAQSAQSPEQLLLTAREEINRLRAEVSALRDRSQQLRTVIERINAIQAEQLDPFVAGKPALVGQLGMTGYAQLMDRFAAAERQVNRAWSAAADGVLEESRLSLDEASAQFEQTVQRLSELKAGSSSDQPVR